MTPEESKTLHVIAALDSERVLYFLADSFASNYYGIPRSTKDADFVLQTHGGLGESFAQRLGNEFIFDPQLSFETVAGTYRQNIRHTKSSFQVELFLLSQDEHDQERFARRRAAKIFDRTIWLLSPEDVIVSKLRWARSKDEDDVKNVMTVQNQKLDWDYIENWCRKHRTLAVMEKIRQSIPEIE